jgi:hypothetical protein
MGRALLQDADFLGFLQEIVGKVVELLAEQLPRASVDIR